MDKHQIKERFSNAIHALIGLIPNHRIDFTKRSIKRNCGLADILQSQGDIVLGIIYNITDEDFISFDMVETVGNNLNL